ncbi:homologous-pairing protein 2 homolog isoform X3 [Leptopilina boulardi]|nr:homologous-pairing protein 2 homolog isoform X3 [Leptopilina boulardi]XP_051157975.1 homologous-pairing protein 2 homolog isoform X3 [Leptopilina boulardi]XP_051157976.1 homologous-pairing protein 2 homolog isoform X3 [Leptopilina boulardi]XP_051157977.1 homologous-pairing protein 2 homolog isoform X3 [Leptopilina boulardi]
MKMSKEIVYKFMKTQNRPFSTNDVVVNLRNELGKSVVQKAFDQLVHEGKLVEKVYGKQKVYCPAQELSRNADELLRIDKELHSHANELESRQQSLEKEVRTIEASLAGLKSSITLEEARMQQLERKHIVDNLTQKLNNLMEASGSEDLTETKRKIENALIICKREYSKRKRIVTEILDCIRENYPGSKIELYEEIGIIEKVL